MRAARKRRPGSKVRFQRRRIKQLMCEQRFDEAIDLLDRFIERNPRHPESLCEKGHIFEFLALARAGISSGTRRRLLGRAGSCYRSALKAAGDCPLTQAAVLRDLADYWNAANDRSRALSTVERGLDLLATRRRSPMVLYWEAEILRTKQVVLGKSRPRVVEAIQRRRAEIERMLDSRRRRRGHPS